MVLPGVPGDSMCLGPWVPKGRMVVGRWLPAPVPVQCCTAGHKSMALGCAVMSRGWC